MIQVINDTRVDFNSLDPAYAQFRDQTRFWIQRVAVPLIMVIGLFGNLITVIIMTRRRMRSTTNLYLAALAFIDMLYLVLTFLLGLAHYPNMAARRYHLYWQLRPFLMMLTDACSNTSVWLTVTFTIERYIAVRYPMKGKVWCTEARAKKLIMFVFAFGLLFASPVPFEWRVIEKNVQLNVSTKLVPKDTVKNASETFHTVEDNKFRANESSSSSNQDEFNDYYRRYNSMIGDDVVLVLENTDFGRNETYKTIYYWSTAVIFYFIPLISLTLFNTFLIKSVHQSQRERSRMTSHQSHHSTASLDKQPKLIYQYNKIQLTTKAQSSSGKVSKCSIIYGYSSQKSHITKLGRNLWKSLGGSCGEGGCDVSAPNGHVCVSLNDSKDSSEVRDKQTIGLKSIASSPPILIVSRQLDNENIEKSIPVNHTKSVPIEKKSDDNGDNANAESKNHESFGNPLIVNCRKLFKNHSNQLRKENGIIEAHTSKNDQVSEQVLNTNSRGGNTSSNKDETLDGYLDTKSLTSNCDKSSNNSIGGLKTPSNSQTLIRKRTATINSSAELLTARNGAIESASNKFRHDLTVETDKSILQSNSIEVLSTDENDIEASRNHIQCRVSSGTIGGYCGSSSCSGSVIVSKDSHQHHLLVSTTSNQERHITIMLIAVVILFLICQIPSAAMLLYSSVHEPVPNTNEHALVLAFGNIFNFLMAINAAGNFILYSFLSKKYRRTFMILFCNCFETWSRVHTNQDQRSKLLQQQSSNSSAYNSTYRNNKSQTNIRFCQNAGQQVPFKNESMDVRDNVLINSGVNVSSVGEQSDISLKPPNYKQRRDTLV